MMRKRERLACFVAVLAMAGLAFCGINEVQALNLTNCLKLSGFVRSEINFRTGVANPTLEEGHFQSDDNNINLFLNTLLTEWTWEPTDDFKGFAQVRLMDDSTERVSKHLPRYYAFKEFEGDSYLTRWTDNTHEALELRTCYLDFIKGDWWIRAGKQSIVWGETDGIRLLDVVNPLDLSKQLFFEPIGEQFDNIRIPLWSLRVTKFMPLGFCPDFTIEGVVIPGTQVHTILPDEGAPYTLVSLPSFIKDQEKGRDGDWSGGGRVYGTLGPVGFTLNYLYAYYQDGILRLTGIAPGGGIAAEWQHPKVNIYGASFNYYIDSIVSVLRAEMVFMPDHPYQDVSTNNRKINEKATFKYVIGLDRPTWFLPKKWTPHAAVLGLQFYQQIREGDKKDIAINDSPASTNEEAASIYIDQPFRHDTINWYTFYNYDFDGAYWFTSGLKFKPGNHWAWEAYYVTCGGSDDRHFKLATFDWVESVLLRMTYYFN